MSFSFNFSCVGVVTSSTVAFGYGLATGGPVVMVTGWIIGSIFTICVGCSLAEICSCYPKMGSVYYWAGVLAPKGYKPSFAFICGWLNFIANNAAISSFAFGLASIIE